jgi:dGTPase
VKHNGPVSDKPRQQIALIDAEFDLALQDHASAEAQLANLADDIAYLSHDFDDGLRAGLFGLDDISDLPQVCTALADINQRYGVIDLGRTTHELVRRLISVFVEDVLTVTAQNFAVEKPSRADDIRKMGRPLVAFSAPMADDLGCLREFLFQHMWRHYKVNRMTSKAKRVVTELFDLFMSETNILPHDWQVSNGTPLAVLPPDKRARIIADYIASMTDRYAIIEHQRLFDLAPVFK